MPTLTTQIPLNDQPFDLVLDSHRLQTFKDHLNEAFTPLNGTLAAPCSSTLAQANDPKAVEVDELVTGEMEVVEGGEVTIVMPYAHLHPVQLTPLQVETTSGQCGTRLAKTPPPMTASRPTSITSYKHSITDVDDHTLFLDHPISNSVEPAIPTDGSSLCSSTSEDAMQPLPLRGRVEARDEYGHCYRPSSIESCFTSYDCSSGSRASSRDLQTPNSCARCQPINNFGYDDHGYFSPNDDNNTLTPCRHQPPSPTMFDNASDTLSSTHVEPSISPALSSNLCQDSTPLHSHSAVTSM